MNPRVVLLLGAGILMLCWLIWRDFALQSEVDALREMVRHPTSPARTVTDKEARFYEHRTEPSVSGTAINEDAEQVAERLAEVERVANETATLLNQTLDQLEERRAAAAKRSWGAEQASGPPDTRDASDATTAWAPAAQDGGEEWLQLDYAAPMEVAQVLVRETHNPGTLSKVCLILEDGRELPIWQGVQAAAPGPIDRVFPVPGGITARGAKVYLETNRVPGWNEIDAVALIGRDGNRQWGKNATASSSYADRSGSRFLWTSGSTEFGLSVEP